MKVLICLVLLCSVMGCTSESCDKVDSSLFQFPSGEYVYRDTKTFSHHPNRPDTDTYGARVEVAGNNLTIPLRVRGAVIIKGIRSGNEFSGTSTNNGYRTNYKGKFTAEYVLEGTLSGGNSRKTWSGPFRIFKKEFSKD